MSVSFLRPNIIIEVIGVWIKKKHKYNKTENIFLKRKSFHNLQKVLKGAALNSCVSVIKYI